MLFVLVASVGTVAASEVARAANSFIKPVPGAITMRFGARYFDAGAGRTRTHCGIDISTVLGSRVRAAAEGKVAFAGRTPLGLCVTILHENGVKTTYLPLQRMDVSSGDTVGQGQSIGLAAGAGDLSSANPHLHMGAVFAGEYIDPEALLAGSYKTDLSKMIRRGDIPPESTGQTQTSLGDSSGARSMTSAILGFINDGAAFFGRLWGYLDKSRMFLVRQTGFIYKTGARLWRVYLGGSGLTRTRGGATFIKRIGVIHFYRPAVTAASTVAVFDPSGDQDESAGRVLISLGGNRAVLSVDIFNEKGTLVRRLAGWGNPAAGVFWTGDDMAARIVEPGRYTIVVHCVVGGSQVFLAEVRWHL